ncbi:hypothetical protein ULF88_11230 [Halopseudomonas pachastrellae]|nr:hypothetical protein [Halopseudomonas pachastrellae]
MLDAEQQLTGVRSDWYKAASKPQRDGQRLSLVGRRAAQAEQLALGSKLSATR